MFKNDIWHHSNNGIPHCFDDLLMVNKLQQVLIWKQTIWCYLVPFEKNIENLETFPKSFFSEKMFWTYKWTAKKFEKPVALVCFLLYSLLSLIDEKRSPVSLLLAIMRETTVLKLDSQRITISCVNTPSRKVTRRQMLRNKNWLS